MVRILHIIDFYGPQGGLNRYLNLERKALSDYDVDNYYLALKSAPFRIKNEEPEFDYQVKNELSIQVFLEQIKPQIINMHVEMSDSDTQYIVENYVSIFTIHSNSLFCPFENFHNNNICRKVTSIDCVDSCITEELYQTVKKRIERYKEVNYIFYMANSIRDKLLNIGYSDSRLIKHPHFIEPAKKFSNVSENRLLFVGRLVEQKGIKSILYALAEIKDLNFSFEIVGTGDIGYIRDIINDSEKLGISDRINYHGYLQWDKIKEMLYHTKVLVFSSIGNETFGYSGAEAVIHGVPVIASDIDGIDEWFCNGKTGLEYQVKNITQIAGHIRTLLTSEYIYSDIKNQCENYSANYNYHEQCSELFNFYSKVASDNY